MRKKILLFITVQFACCCLLHSQGKYLETIKVTDSIYVFKPKLDWTHGNGVAIIGKDGVFFIDTYIQTNYAEEAIQRLKAVTDLPVIYILNTHWHYDHVMGNHVFKKVYPSCKIIMHDSTYRFMNTLVKNRIATEMDQARSDQLTLKKEMDDGKTARGAIITENMKPFWQWMIREAAEYENSYTGNQPVNADITFSDSLTFHWGTQTIHVIHASDKGHSAGDAIVWIPEKKLVVTGDILVGPTPYATYINAPGIVKAIQKIMDIQPAIIIPGHGPIEYGLQYATLVQRAFSIYLAAAEKAVDNNIPVNDALAGIAFPEIDIQFTGDDDVKKWAYRTFFVRNLINNTYRRKGK